MPEQTTYQDSFGKVEYPEDFEALIEGLPIGEQVRFFRLGNGLYTRVPVHERRKNEYDFSCCLDEDKNVKSIIVKDGKIAGIMVLNIYGKIVPCMVENRYCIRDDEEYDGNGYKSLTLYRYLICVSGEFDRL
ncbi:MAG: hypothetical protein KH452_12685 [Clostridiales bacterium]|nr:hypothetical protein [Clostridiales bacterium]